MSDHMDFDLDAILAEFRSSGEESPAQEVPAPAPTAAPKEPAAPQAAAPRRSVRVHPVPAGHRAKAPAADETPKEQKAPAPARGPESLPSPAEEATTVFPAKPPRREGASRPQPEKKLPPLPKQPAAKAPAVSRQWHTVQHLLSLVFAAVSLLCLLWLAVHVHPGSGRADTTAKEDLTSRLDRFVSAAAAAALGDEADLPRLYAISESATVAPAPDPDKFGSTTDPAEIQAVIDQAAGLLEGQSLAWDPNAAFFPGAQICYYLDDSLFVLAWKEVIDGRCCSCAEVKIADGSQIRRKLAEDSYGSSVQLYATQMAKEANAVVAINGDFYAFRNLGITVYQRQLYRCNPNQVDTCFFTADGDMLFAYAGQLKSQAEAEQFIRDHNVVFSLAFGPVLIDNGELKTVTSYPVGEIERYYSRSSIGMLDTRHYLLMTVNAEGDCQLHCTTAQSGQLMQSKGCQNAYSLDGGQTAIIVFNGEAFNRVDWDSERSMSDILYFATAIHTEEVSP